MTRRVMLTLVVLAAASGTGWIPGDVAAQQPAARLVSTDRTAVIDVTNAARRGQGLPPLREDMRRDRAAQIQAEQLAATGRLEHELKKVTFPTPVDRLKEAGDAWAAYGENIAEGQRTAQDVVASWMKSPPHRANILDTGFTEIGVGWAVDAAGRNHFAQVFGRPMAPASSR